MVRKTREDKRRDCREYYKRVKEYADEHGISLKEAIRLGAGKKKKEDMCKRTEEHKQKIRNSLRRFYSRKPKVVKKPKVKKLKFKKLKETIKTSIPNDSFILGDKVVNTKYVCGSCGKEAKVNSQQKCSFCGEFLIRKVIVT